MAYKVDVVITYREGVLNPEARTIEDAANQLEFKISELIWGKYGSYISNKKSKNKVRKEARGLCEKLLANPVIENYEITSIKKIK